MSIHLSAIKLVILRHFQRFYRFFESFIEIEPMYNTRLQTESRQMEYQMNEINFLISLAWAEGGIVVGDLMVKIEKCCEWVLAPLTPQKSEN